MRRISKLWKRLTMLRRQRLLLRLAVLFLITLMTCVLTPTCSFATVTQTGENQVQMSGVDLQKLIDNYVKYRAEAKSYKESLDSERQAHMEYSSYVGTLIQAQSDERKAFQKLITKLERELNAPQLELYGGYNTDYQWEGGIRLVWKIK